MYVVLDDKQADQLEQMIRQQMFVYRDNPNGSDYSCGWCGQYKPPGSSFQHSDDCEGEAMLKLLSQRQSNVDVW